MGVGRTVTDELARRSFGAGAGFQPKRDVPISELIRRIVGTPSVDTDGVISAVEAVLTESMVDVDCDDNRSSCLAQVGRSGGGRNADGIAFLTRRTCSLDVVLHSSSSDSLPDHPFPLVRTTPERRLAIETDARDDRRLVPFEPLSRREFGDRIRDLRATSSSGASISDVRPVLV